LFEEYEQWNTLRLTQKKSETWLNHTCHPHIVSTQVFEWVKSNIDPTELVQWAVLKLAREETLGNYSESQRWYDTFYNEWDCCKDFGPGDLDDEDKDKYFLPVKIDADWMHDPPI
jgi:hypothetical protein